jgi:hypothetical protein
MLFMIVFTSVICVDHKDVYVMLLSVLLFAIYTGYIICYILCFLRYFSFYTHVCTLGCRLFHAARVVVLFIGLYM